MSRSSFSSSSFSQRGSHDTEQGLGAAQVETESRAADFASVDAVQGFQAKDSRAKDSRAVRWAVAQHKRAQAFDATRGPLRPQASKFEYLCGFLLMTLFIGLFSGYWAYALACSVFFVVLHWAAVRWTGRK